MYEGIYNVTLEVYDMFGNFLGVTSKNIESLSSSFVYNALSNEINIEAYDKRYFGESVSIDNNFLAVGSPGNYFDYDGYCYMYNYDEINDSWELVQDPFNGDDSETFDRFGYSVAVSGDYLVVGAPNHTENNGQVGAGYVFHYNGSDWQQVAKLVPSDAISSDHVGHSVAIDGDYLVIGCNVPSGDNDTLFIGNNNPKNHPGKAYIYKLENGVWIEKDKIYSDNGYVGDDFGYSVSISGNRIAVGADGFTYIFEKQSNDNWLQVSSLMNTIYQNIVSIDNNRLIVGSAVFSGSQFWVHGSAKIYEYEDGEWVVKSLLENNVTNKASFGAAVSIKGNYAVVGAPSDNTNGNSYSGSAFFYRRNNFGNWELIYKFTPQNGNDNYACGTSVSMGNLHIAVGEPYNDYYSPTKFKGSIFYFNNYVQPCDVIINETSYQPAPGIYPDKKAGSITLGGESIAPDEVYYQSGVEIKYIGGEIHLLPGCTIENGSSFTASSMNCSGSSGKACQYLDFQPKVILEDDNIENLKDVKNQYILVFPNPTTNILNIIINENLIEKITNIYLYDILGNTMVIIDDDISENVTLDLSNYPKGIYFIKIQTSEKTYIKKIIKQ